MNPTTERETILDDARHAVINERQDEYGDLEDNFEAIARLWSSHLTTAHNFLPELDSIDVAIMMALLKLARLGANPDHADSWVDTAGYAACGGELAKAAQHREARAARLTDLIASKEKYDREKAATPTPTEATTPTPRPVPEPNRETLEHSIQRIICHRDGECQQYYCPVHHRSDHTLRAWEQSWRSDVGIMERVCPHGTGHPDPDSPYDDGDLRWTHGCCSHFECIRDCRQAARNQVPAETK